ncbi:MAG: hypothetical protein ACRCUE_01975 [Bosea sp. (in: a-proteobacteria)]
MSQETRSYLSLAGAPLARIIHTLAGAVYIRARLTPTNPILVVPEVARIFGGADLPIPTTALKQVSFGPARVLALNTKHDLANHGEAEDAFAIWGAATFGKLHGNLHLVA